MTSKSLGLKSGPKCDRDLDKLKKENCALKKKLEESKTSEAERNRLLETRNNAINAKNNALVQEAQEGARRIENISSEIRKQIPDVPPRIAQPKTSRPHTGQDPPKASAPNYTQILEAQLKDALEKNQQWLVYDQQREAFVHGLMARISNLEQQAASTEKKKDLAKEISCEGENKQKYYDQLLVTAKIDLEGERQIVEQLNSELSEMRMKLEEKQKEAADLSNTLKSRSDDEMLRREDESRYLKDKMQRQKRELDAYREMYDEEKRRNAELSSRMEKMQHSLMKQHEDQQKAAILEQQIQKCASELENEKLDRNNVQHQLNKVLKELRKTQEQIPKLEPGKRDIYFVDKGSNFSSEFDKLSKREKYPSPKPRSLLDESFLECPRCQTMYPASQHRELLAHIDICTS